MQAHELSHLFCWNAYNAALQARGAKGLEDIVCSYTALLTIKMKLKEASTFYLQLSRQFSATVASKHLLHYNLWAVVLF